MAGLGVEHVGAGVAADHHRDVRLRQMGELRRPEAAGLLEARCGDPLQGRRVVQDVRALRQPVLRGGDHQIEALDRRPRPAAVDQAHRAVGVSLDPAAGRLVAPSGRDDQVGPGRDQRARFPPDDAEQGERRQEVGQKLGRTIDQMLDLERPAERLGERQDLGIVPGLVAHHHPDPRRRRRRALAQAVRHGRVRCRRWHALRCPDRGPLAPRRRRGGRGPCSSAA